MPKTPRPACKRSNCPHRAATGSPFCVLHGGDAPPRLPDERPSASRRGYDARWQKVRRMFLAGHPLCQDCLEYGLTVAATEVHHVRPLAQCGVHSDDNLLALCKTCHSRRTAQRERRP